MYIVLNIEGRDVALFITLAKRAVTSYSHDQHGTVLHSNVLHGTMLHSNVLISLSGKQSSIIS